MPTISDNAVCLQRWSFSETSQTVLLFTREHGLLRGLAKGARRPKSTFQGGFDSLTRGQIVAIVKPGRELATLTHWHLETRWERPRTDLEANRACMFMLDLIRQLFEALDPHPQAYDGLMTSLDAIDAGSDVGLMLLHFQWRVLREAGFQPVLDHDAERGTALDPKTPTLAFSPTKGGVVADSGHGDRWRVRRSTIELLRAVNQGIADANAEDDTVVRANHLLAAYVRAMIGREPPTLGWAFPDLPA